MTKKTKKKKREAAMLKSLTEGLQQIAQGGDAASVVMNLVDASSHCPLTNVHKAKYCA